MVSAGGTDANGAFGRRRAVSKRLAFRHRQQTAASAGGTVSKKLIAVQGGFNCISCHGVGKQPAVAPFEAPGINLLDAAQRLRHDYYPRWMIDPTRVDLNTRMPKFSMDGSTTPLKDVLEGNDHRQFEAIWHYLATLPENEKP